MSDVISPSAVDFIMKERGIGELSRTSINLFRGINHQNIGAPVRANTDTQGLLFFTKPELNLTYDNIINAAEISNLVREGTEKSMLGAIRAYLDPHSNKYGGYVGTYDKFVISGDGKPIDCPIVDGNFAFMPLLTNTCTSLTGWPDITVDTYTSEAGIFGEAISMADGGSCIYGTFDITASFNNIEGDPITALFFNWCVYINRVVENSIAPWPSKIVEDELDYQTRIYRLVFNENKTHVTKIACTGASFPIASTIGASYNYSTEKTFIEDNNQISVPFRCVGAIYESPQIIEDFNDSVIKWEPRMKPNASGVITGMKKLTRHECTLDNYQGYPRIEHDRSINWYITHEQYSEFLNYYGIDPDRDSQARPKIQTPISADVSAANTIAGQLDDLGLGDFDFM